MSSDDIVKRLRGWVCSDAWNRAVGEMRDAADAIEARDAQIQNLLAAFSAVVEDAITKQDEIKRLRDAGDALAESALRQQWSSLDVAIAAWEKARRG